MVGGAVPRSRAIFPTMHTRLHAIVRSCALRALVPAIFTLLPACATRTSKPTLNGKWESSEPVVNLGRYESVQKRPGQRRDIAVAVAISGGGMRAANFAAGVLGALEGVHVRGADGRDSNLLREVDYFSTASGGGLAAASYLVHLADYKQRHPEDPTAAGFRFASEGAEGVKSDGGRNWREALARNYQASLVRAMLNPFLRGSMNRGDVLERRLGESVLGKVGGRTLTLGDVWVAPGHTPTLPFWVANATVYENGAIFPFTPDIIETYGIKRYCHDEKYQDLASPRDLPLAVGMKASASFPVAIPTTNLISGIDRQNPTLHLMDGGVADNLGVITAARLLGQDRVASKKVLIVIDAYNGTAEPFSNGGMAPGIFTTALRSTSISLDSAHQRVGNLLALVARTDGIKTAVVDFHQARKKQAVDDLRAAETTGEAAAAMRGMTEKAEDTSPQTIDALFTQALGMGTWFKIKKSNQDALLRTGANAIYVQDGAAAPAAQRRLLKDLQQIKNVF